METYFITFVFWLARSGWDKNFLFQSIVRYVFVMNGIKFMKLNPINWIKYVLHIYRIKQEEFKISFLNFAQSWKGYSIFFSEFKMSDERENLWCPRIKVSWRQIWHSWHLVDSKFQIKIFQPTVLRKKIIINGRLKINVHYEHFEISYLYKA